MLPHAFGGGGRNQEERNPEVGLCQIKIKAKEGLRMILEVTGKKKDRNGREKRASENCR